MCLQKANNIYNLILISLSPSWDGWGGASGTRWPREALSSLSQRRAPITSSARCPRVDLADRLGGGTRSCQLRWLPWFPDSPPRHPQCPGLPAAIFDLRVPETELPDPFKVGNFKQGRRVKTAKPQKRENSLEGGAGQDGGV